MGSRYSEVLLNPDGTLHTQHVPAALKPDAISSAIAAGTDGVIFHAANHGAPGTNAGDELTALNALVTTAKAARAYGRVTIALNGTHQINGTLTGLDGVTLDFTQGKLVQTAALTRSIVIDNSSQVRLIRPRIEGKGATDYTNTSAVYGAAAIQVRGTSHHVWIVEPEISGCAGPGVQLGANTSDTTVHHVWVRGGSITGLGSPTISSTSQNYAGGVVVDDGVSDWWVQGVEISQYAQGIVTGDTTRPHVDDNDIHDITGQHGIYLDAVTGPGSVQRNFLRNCGLLGMKIQIANAGTHDITDVVVGGNIAWNCGDNGFLIANAIGLGGVNKRGLRLKFFGNLAYNCAGDGFRLQNVSGGSFSGNDAYTVRNGWYLQDCTDLVIDTYTEHTSKNAIKIEDSTSVTVRGKGKDPATGQVASDNYGIYVTGASDRLDVDGFQVDDTLGNILYGAYFQGTGYDTSRWRNFKSRGHTSKAIRLPTSATVAEWVNMPALTDVLNPPSQARNYDANLLIARTFDPAVATVSQAVLTAGVMYGVRIQFSEGGLISNVLYSVSNAGATLTSGQCLIGVFNEAGTLIGTSADLSAVWTSTGNKTTAISSVGGASLTLTHKSYVDVTFLFNGTTSPQFRGVSGTGQGNIGIVTVSANRFYTTGSSLTALPSTLGTKVPSTSEAFVGLN